MCISKSYANTFQNKIELQTPYFKSQNYSAQFHNDINIFKVIKILVLKHSSANNLWVFMYKSVIKSGILDQ